MDGSTGATLTIDINPRRGGLTRKESGVEASLGSGDGQLSDVVIGTLAKAAAGGRNEFLGPVKGPLFRHPSGEQGVERGRGHRKAVLLHGTTRGPVI